MAILNFAEGDRVRIKPEKLNGLTVEYQEKIANREAVIIALPKTDSNNSLARIEWQKRGGGKRGKVWIELVSRQCLGYFWESIK